jgi:hypothetical protein
VRPLAIALLLAAAACAGPGGEPEPEAPRVTVSGWRWDFDAKAPGFCIGRGYVRNAGNAAITNVQFAVTFFDAANVPVATGKVTANKPVLEVGEQSSFSFNLPCPQGSDSAELKATHGFDKPLVMVMRG